MVVARVLKVKFQGMSVLLADPKGISSAFCPHLRLILKTQKHLHADSVHSFALIN